MAVEINADQLNNYSGIWVLIEHIAGQIAPVSWELMGEGRKLADKLGVQLAGVLLGLNVQSIATEAFKYGADIMYVVDSPVLEKYRSSPYAKCAVNLVEKYKPEIFLMGATTIGRDLSGVVATKLETGLTADCTMLDIDPVNRQLLQTRPAFGGNIMATILCPHRRPQMATVRPRVMEMPIAQEGKQGQLVVEQIDLKEEDVLTKVLDIVQEAGQPVYLDKAEIIVTGGRGVSGKNHWPMIEDLARVIGGTVGATRSAVEAGWVPFAHQIGQTGQTVRPKIYIGIGVSGAIQHLVGMQSADIIVAINNNPQAPIFKVATYGIIGDLFQIVPELTTEFKQRLSGHKLTGG